MRQPGDQAITDGYAVVNLDDAVELTRKHYPQGPEKLADQMGVVVLESPLRGAAGWCIKGKQPRIRLDTSTSVSRKRFTLAHELAHLVLGTDPDLVLEPFQSNRQEEREADRVASIFLIPDERLRQVVGGQVHVDAKKLQRVAKEANVSPVMAARRVVADCEELGLVNAAVFYFEKGELIWSYSESLQFAPNEPAELFREAKSAYPTLARSDNGDGNINVCSLLQTEYYELLLVQLLHPLQADEESLEERRRRLAAFVFRDDNSFRQSVAGSLGVVRQKCKGRSLDEAVAYFEANYLGTKYIDTKMERLRSPEGREYLKIHLSRWFAK